MEWQPIETAPKEPNEHGITPRVILGFAPDETGYSPESCEGAWSVALQRWSSSLDPTWDSSPQPTHWMQRPDPPRREVR